MKKNNKDNGILFAKFNICNLVTYLGVAFGVLAMYLSFTAIAFVTDNSDTRIRYALACLVISGVCDMFDGKFARLFKRTNEEKEFGVQLDSLCDTFCFLAVPVVFMLSLNMTSWYHYIAYALFIICGVSRLGYFNVKSADTEKAIKTYQGLPVTSTAISFPLVGLLRNVICPDPSNLSNLYWAFFGITVLTAILMVVNIKIPKLKGVAYIIVPILAAILVGLLLFL